MPYEAVVSPKLVGPLSRPTLRTTWLGAATFGWASPLLSLGNRRQLSAADMSMLPPPSATVAALTSTFAFTYSQHGASLVRAYVATYWPRLVCIAGMQLTAAACDLYGPGYVLHQVVTSVQTTTSTGFDGSSTLWLLLSLFGLQITSAFVKAHLRYHIELTGIQFSASVRTLLFESVLHPNDASCQQTKSNAADVANLFAVDLLQLMKVTSSLTMMWITPVQITVVVVLLHQLVGWAIFVGVGVIVLILVTTSCLAASFRGYQRNLLQRKDARMQIVHDLFGSIAMVKLNAWEEQFLAKVTTLRHLELVAVWKYLRTFWLLATCMLTTPVVVTVSIFAAYTLWLQKLLTVATVFATLALFRSLQDALIQLPAGLTGLIQCMVSISRIQREIRLHATTVIHDDYSSPDDDDTVRDNGDNAVTIAQGTFAWDQGDDEEPVLTDVNVVLPRGTFTVICGAVGQGKSTLCAALLGELTTSQGHVSLGYGTVGYVAQRPWIQAATLRDNVLFGAPFDRVRYHQVLHACGLTADVAAFPAGDRTEIGPKGVNLSGGQQARVSLARACYANPDMYILDAPLAAVDATVANHIFRHCFLSYMRHKTVVLVTHHPDILASPHVDRVLQVQNTNVVDITPAKPTDDAAHMEEKIPVLSNPKDDTFEGEDAFEPEGELVVAGDVVVAVEGRATGQVSKAVIHAYIQAIGGYSVLVVLFVLTVAVEAVRVVSDLWLSHWSSTTPISVAMPSNSSIASATLVTSTTKLGVYGLLIFTLCVCTMLQLFAVFVFTLRGSKRLFGEMMQGLLTAPVSFFDANPIGRLLNRLGDDVLQTDLSLPVALAPTLCETAMALSKIGTAVVITQWMGLLVLPLLFVYVKLGGYFLAPLRELNRLQKTARSPLLTAVSDGLDGAATIRAFRGQRTRVLRQHVALVDEFCATQVATAAVNQWFALRVELLSNGIVLALLIGVVVLHDSISPGLVGLVVAYGLSVPATLASLVTFWAQLEVAMIAPERLLEYIHLDKEGARHEPGDTTRGGEWPAQGHIAFENVSFQYSASGPLVLCHVSFQIQSGENVGVVGRTGAGKSSLVQTLFRMYPLTDGRIVIDGVDIATVGLRHLRSRMAIVPQNPVLFRGTIRHYLDPTDAFADDAPLWRALSQVELMDRVAHDEKKLHSEVAELGNNFSAGERQLLCLARALLRQAKVVVLDEATAAIDHDTDTRLQRVVREEFSKSTVLTIAHRLDTVLDYDRILVLDQGQVVQLDTPAALLAQRGGIFFDLVADGGPSFDNASLGFTELSKQKFILQFPRCRLGLDDAFVIAQRVRGLTQFALDLFEVRACVSQLKSSTVPMMWQLCDNALKSP
ncbi:hypothetical protein DYB38_001634 [Aphanomyces astaci]|uniref:Uncharacterized protein n=1 Tax=Aphanomyces astaci TaxID=112090 RepID=A0A397D807_APHAT|nr:hypothetical protein DYB38_001634 [Aphanomyces astaci]